MLRAGAGFAPWSAAVSNVRAEITPYSTEALWSFSCITWWMAKADDDKGFKITPADIERFSEVLEHKRAELVSVLQKRSDIAIEKSADQLDEIQYATERDLAIQNVDRDSTLLREVKAALLRVRTGSYGVCVECELVISPRRLAAVPWALCCIRCQEADDLSGRQRSESTVEALIAGD